ncbi:hypothetical protein [Burkholderia ubonensis]|uniref:hypothetical protein n=1 Tax=Burkholderia ubonensis TaxID=101571 RepID=UPI00076C8948|nr:hypothetical protein [Burkholderia ubonensis]KVV07323.1 hypothetical protein WK77_16160 [Burkholderia ubonensis]
MSNDRVVPIALMQWANEEWVSRFWEEAGLPMTAILEADPNVRVSALGSRMLHLTAMSPQRPSKEVAKTVMGFLLRERGADPNIADDYGRTPLTLFVTSATGAWRGDDEYGCEVLSLLFEHGADANVQFTPDFVHIAQCGRWTLAHHLSDDYHGSTKLPRGMRDMLEARLDRSIPNSAGRTAELVQFELPV